MVKGQLTNEEFTNSFDNKFLLALHMIDVAQQYIIAGEEVNLSRLMSEMRKQSLSKKESDAR